MNQAQQGGLRSALAGVSPPPNPKTPAQRDDPQHKWYLALQRIRTTVKDLIERELEDKDQPTSDIFLAMHAALEKLLAGIDPKTVAGFMAASAVKSINPQIASQLEIEAAQAGRPPQVQGMPNLVGMPQPPLGGGLMPAQGPPTGAPPMGAAEPPGPPQGPPG
jgi:hypothetical protein